MKKKCNCFPKGEELLSSLKTFENCSPYSQFLKFGKELGFCLEASNLFPRLNSLTYEAIACLSAKN